MSPAVLLGDDAKRAARAGPSRGSRDDAAAPRSYADVMSSPWAGLLGGLSNVVEALRGEGVPPPAVRAVVHAALRTLDAELLNALMLRRDCCSTSAVKALQAGLADVRAWAGYVGAEWAGEAADADAALEHASQAAAYLLHGKDDCVRKATKGFDVGPDLKRACPSLSLAQVYKLTEHHHDDWIAGGGATDTLALLRTLQSAATAGTAGGRKPGPRGRAAASGGSGEEEGLEGEDE